MNAVVEQHRQACRGFSNAVAAAAGRWDAPSPCAEWDARAVVEHVIGFHDALILRPRAAKPTRPRHDVAARWAVTVEALFSVLADPANLDDDLMALLPALTTEVVVHTWDLSRATGSPVTLDPDLCRAGYERAAGQSLHVRAPDMFAPAVPVGNVTDLADQLVALFGRDPEWSPPSPLPVVVGSGTDRRLLVSQYATSANLAARVSIYGYLDQADDPIGGLDAWVVDHVDWHAGMRAADVGCGPGPYLAELCHRADVVAAVDLSIGMLHEARTRIPAAATCLAVAGDASELPLTDDSVDVVLAAHMLYHVPDIGRALAEFRRVLRPGGTLLVVLNGSADKREMREVWRAAADIVGKPFEPPWWGERANLDNAPALLAPRFDVVNVDRLTGVFRFPTSSPPLIWADSLRLGTEALLDDAGWTAVRDQVKRTIDLAIARDGEFRVTKESGVIVAR